MSRTKRKVRKGTFRQDGTKIVEGGDAWAKNNRWIRRKKMKPYTKKPSYGKYETDRTEFGRFAKGVSANDKLVTKNANRSRKKGVRQQLKKELWDTLKESNTRMAK